MSNRKIVNALTSFGLSREDVKLYLALAINGPQNSQAIQEALELDFVQIVLSLKTLEDKGLVKTDREVFEAVPFEKVLDMLVKTNLDEAQSVEDNREKILNQWQSYLKRRRT